jgi:type II secretory pathway pseudopilin PulG
VTAGRRNEGWNDPEPDHTLMTALAYVSSIARRSRGFSLVGIVVTLLVIAVSSVMFYTYLGATRKGLEAINTERPTNQARLMADLETLAAIRTQLNVYRSGHGDWPPSREALAALLRPTPRFQCAGQDYTYEPASGALGLVVMDAGRC